MTMYGVWEVLKNDPKVEKLVTRLQFGDLEIVCVLYKSRAAANRVAKSRRKLAGIRSTKVYEVEMED